MITQFLLDILHLGFLGVMKKLLAEFWLTNVVGTKLSKIKIMTLSQRLMNLASQIPLEFQRKGSIL